MLFFSDFDEEDPLAGIPLSDADDDDDDFGLPIKKKTVAKQSSQQKTEQPVQQKSEETSPRAVTATQDAAKGILILICRILANDITIVP